MATELGCTQRELSLEVGARGFLGFLCGALECAATSSRLRTHDGSAEEQENIPRYRWKQKLSTRNDNVFKSADIA